MAQRNTALNIDAVQQPQADCSYVKWEIWPEIWPGIFSWKIFQAGSRYARRVRWAYRRCTTVTGELLIDRGAIMHKLGQSFMTAKLWVTIMCYIYLFITYLLTFLLHTSYISYYKFIHRHRVTIYKFTNYYLLLCKHNASSVTSANTVT